MNQLSIPEKYYNFRLGIADFTISVNCSHYQLAENLAARYTCFPPGKSTHFHARIDWVGTERNSSLLDTKSNFKKGILHFSASGYQGYIDEKAGYGYLRLSSVQPVEDIDYYLRVALALLVHDADCILMHTAGIARNGQSYLFFGHSGSGKTTICRVSANMGSKDNLTILNDDLILLERQEEKWVAHGTPFWNPTQIEPSNQCAPIAAMYYLIQDKEVYKRKLTQGMAIAALLSNVPVIPQDSLRSIHLVDRLTQFFRFTPVYELHFLPNNSFWNVIQD